MTYAPDRFRGCLLGRSSLDGLGLGNGGLLGGKLGSSHLGLGHLGLVAAGDAGVGHELAHEGDGRNSVIVAGDADAQLGDLVGVGVGVEQSDDRDVEAASLLDGWSRSW